VSYARLGEVFGSGAAAVTAAAPFAALVGAVCKTAAPKAVQENLGRDGALWVGTRGARTLCHQDTYGWNVVVQLHGTKSWYLAPPGHFADGGDSTASLPSRVPYEESTVGLRGPDVRHGTQSGGKRGPWVFQLEAGDALIVPPRWWHDVQCESDVAVSVNQWIPLPAADREARVDEALVRH
jgi:HSPB1-associated protein 1